MKVQRHSLICFLLAFFVSNADRNRGNGITFAATVFETAKRGLERLLPAHLKGGDFAHVTVGTNIDGGVVLVHDRNAPATLNMGIFFLLIHSSHICPSGVINNFEEKVGREENGLHLRKKRPCFFTRLFSNGCVWIQHSLLTNPFFVLCPDQSQCQRLST